MIPYTRQKAIRARGAGVGRWGGSLGVGRWGGSPGVGRQGWVARGGSRWVARPSLLSLLISSDGWVGGQRPATHPRTDRQTTNNNNREMPNQHPQIQRAQESNTAARHPLALMLIICYFGVFNY